MPNVSRISLVSKVVYTTLFGLELMRISAGPVVCIAEQSLDMWDECGRVGGVRGVGGVGVEGRQGD